MLARFIVAIAAAFTWDAADLYRQGSALFDKGEFAQAAVHFEQARRIAPKDARLAKALGVSYAAMSDYERANEPLQDACRIDRSLEDACYFYGRNLYALNRFDLALEALNHALRATQQPWRVHLGLAQAYEALARPHEAEAGFRKAIELFEPIAPARRGRAEFDPRLNYATFLYRQGRLEEALTSVRKAIADAPSHPRGHFEAGRILHQQGNLSGAASELEKAVAQGAGSPAHLLLGKVYQRLGRETDAERHLKAGAAAGSEPAVR